MAKTSSFTKLALLGALSTAVAFGATDVDNALGAMGGQAQELVRTTVASWLWIVGVVVILACIAAFMATWTWINKKEEQNNGQSKPVVMRWGMCIGAFVVTFIVMMIFVGGAGLVFLEGKTITINGQQSKQIDSIGSAFRALALDPIAYMMGAGGNNGGTGSQP